MTNQPSLFDLATGLALKEEAVAKVIAHADPLWKKEAFASVVKWARTGKAFTSDEVWNDLKDVVSTPEPRAMGALILKASRENLIKPTGEYWQSKRPECHGRRITVWIGVVGIDR